MDESRGGDTDEGAADQRGAGAGAGQEGGAGLRAQQIAVRHLGGGLESGQGRSGGGSVQYAIMGEAWNLVRVDVCSTPSWGKPGDWSG